MEKGKIPLKFNFPESGKTTQISKCFWMPFYIMYVLERLWLLIKYRDSRKAYLNISFEREAYRHGHDLSYLSRRPRFASFKLPTNSTFAWRHESHAEEQRSRVSKPSGASRLDYGESAERSTSYASAGERRECYAMAMTAALDLNEIE